MANWLCVGYAQGCGKLDVNRQFALPLKSIWLKPLQKSGSDNMSEGDASLKDAERFGDNAEDTQAVVAYATWLNQCLDLQVDWEREEGATEWEPFEDGDDISWCDRTIVSACAGTAGARRPLPTPCVARDT